MLVAAVAYLFPVKDGSYIFVGFRTRLEQRSGSISFSTVSLVITLFSSSSVVVVAGTGVTLLSEASGFHC